MQCKKQFCRGARRERRFKSELRIKPAEMLGQPLANTFRVLVGHEPVAVIKVNGFDGHIIVVSGQLSGAALEQVKKQLAEQTQ